MAIRSNEPHIWDYVVPLFIISPHYNATVIFIQSFTLSNLNQGITSSSCWIMGVIFATLMTKGGGDGVSEGSWVIWRRLCIREKAEMHQNNVLVRSLLFIKHWVKTDVISGPFKMNQTLTLICPNSNSKYLLLSPYHTIKSCYGNQVPSEDTANCCISYTNMVHIRSISIVYMQYALYSTWEGAKCEWAFCQINIQTAYWVLSIWLCPCIRF